MNEETTMNGIKAGVFCGYRIISMYEDFLPNVKTRVFKFRNPWYLRIFKGKYRCITGSITLKPKAYVFGNTICLPGKQYDKIKDML